MFVHIEQCQRSKKTNRFRVRSRKGTLSYEKWIAVAVAPCEQLLKNWNCTAFLDIYVEPPERVWCEAPGWKRKWVSDKVKVTGSRSFHEVKGHFTTCDEIYEEQALVFVCNRSQWLIQDFLQKGAPTRKAKFSWKLHDNEENWAGGWVCWSATEDCPQRRKQLFKNNCMNN